MFSFITLAFSHHENFRSVFIVRFNFDELFQLKQKSPEKEEQFEQNLIYSQRNVRTSQAQESRKHFARIAPLGFECMCVSVCVSSFLSSNLNGLSHFSSDIYYFSESIRLNLFFRRTLHSLHSAIANLLVVGAQMYTHSSYITRLGPNLPYIHLFARISKKMTSKN